MWNVWKDDDSQQRYIACCVVKGNYLGIALKEDDDIKWRSLFRILLRLYEEILDDGMMEAGWHEGVYLFPLE